MTLDEKSIEEMHKRVFKACEESKKLSHTQVLSQ